jgi:four helix bundle protein
VLKQLVRSAGSVGANFIEANEALSPKDFALRVKICRKEAKESVYWLSLLQLKTEGLEKERIQLSNEATELMRIFGAIIEKTKKY